MFLCLLVFALITSIPAALYGLPTPPIVYVDTDGSGDYNCELYFTLSQQPPNQNIRHAFILSLTLYPRGMRKKLSHHRYFAGFLVSSLVLY